MQYKRQTLLSSLIVAISLSIVSSTGQSQEKSSEQSKSDIVKLNIYLVTLDAQVLRQNTDRIAWKLKQDDFVLFEDGIKQKIINFSQDTLPLSVILLIDRRGCLDPFSDKIQKAVGETIKELKTDDELAVMTFSDKTELVLPFNTDKTKVVETLAKLPAHDDAANHCFNAAFYDAASYMREAGNPIGRRVIILITGITKGINCGRHSSEEARTEVLESGSTVCALVPHEGKDMLENGVMHGATDIGKVIGVGTLNVKSLIEETGGELVSAKPDNIEFLFDNLITRIRTRYALGFVSTNTKRDGAYRRLKLQVAPDTEKREGKLIVKTRRGYLAPKETRKD